MLWRWVDKEWEGRWSCSERAWRGFYKQLESCDKMTTMGRVGYDEDRLYAWQWRNTSFKKKTRDKIHSDSEI